MLICRRIVFQRVDTYVSMSGDVLGPKLGYGVTLRNGVYHDLAVTYAAGSLSQYGAKTLCVVVRHRTCC